MDVTPLVRKGQQIIQVYAGGVFKISGESYHHAVFVTSEKSFPWNIGEYSELSQLQLEHFTFLIDIAKDFDVFLLGTGKKIEFLNPAIKKSLRQQNIHIEVMDTGAACRTYNVLMAEGRRVGALLLPV